MERGRETTAHSNFLHRKASVADATMHTLAADAVGRERPVTVGGWAARARALLDRFPVEAAVRAADEVSACYERGGKVLVCGNGGSAMEAEHLAGELVGKLERDRAPLPALALHENPAALTAVANDYGYDGAFAHQVEALGVPGDVLVAISTSGDSENVVRAVLAAQGRGMTTVGFLGAGGSGGRLGALVDVPVVLDAEDTPTIQTGHMVLTHTICGLVEEALFPNKAVFLDRDGTLIVNRHYGSDPEAIVLLPGVAEGLAELRGAGYRLVLISNQSGVARGFFDEAAVARMHDRLQRMLDASGAALDGIEYCPHHPEGTVAGYAVPCSCRKPEPGMIRNAARKHGVDLSSSWMVGDIEADVEAGRRSGARTVLIGPEPSRLTPDHRAADFADAVQHILSRDARPEPTDGFRAAVPDAGLEAPAGAPLADAASLRLRP